MSASAEISDSTSSCDQPPIDTLRRVPALANRPDDQRLPATRIPGGENSGNARLMFIVGCNVAAKVEVDAEVGQESVLYRTREAHRQKHEIGLDLEFSTSDRGEAGATVGAGLRLEAD